MVLHKLIPRILTASLAIGILSISAFAQSSETRPRIISNPIEAGEISSLHEDHVFISNDASPDSRTSKPPLNLPTLTTRGYDYLRFEPLLLAAIDQRLGSRYSWGAEGPDRFDCSGFVWSIFNSVGIEFERVSARTLWSRFSPANSEEQYKLGTLVFFSGLTHVGVVADEDGFYHASRRHGVIYSPFNDYWVKRIDGFRKVPVPTTVAE